MQTCTGSQTKFFDLKSVAMKIHIVIFVLIVEQDASP